MSADNSTSSSSGSPLLAVYFLLLLSSGPVRMVSAQSDCLDPRWDEGDQVEENFQDDAVQCDVLISETRREVDEGDDVTVQCNTRITDTMDRILSECRWYTPDGAECLFDMDVDNLNGRRRQGTTVGDYCSGDSSVQFVGNFATSSCDIIIREFEDKHDGLWKCVAGNAEVWVDTVDLVMDGHLETSTVLAITIPIAVLVLIAILVLLICLCCPAWCAACVDVFRRNKPEPEPKVETVPVVTTSLPPLPRDQQAPQPLGPRMPFVEDSAYEVTSESSAYPLAGGQLSSSSASHDPNYERVSYMHPKPSIQEPGHYGQQQDTRTAKKISNISFFSNRSSRA